jgi:tetratricopeptide (TPR) repeat protein
LARTGTGAYDEAIADFDRAMKLRPEAYLPLVAKAWALVRIGREDEAAAAMRRVVATKPRDVGYAVSLARILRNLGQDAESVAVLRRAQAENPDEIGLALYLAWELATNPDAAARDGARALQLAEKALQARAAKEPGGANPDELDTLAAAYAELGRFDEAVTVMDRVLRAAGSDADPDLVAEWTARRAGYAEKRPFRDG